LKEGVACPREESGYSVAVTRLTDHAVRDRRIGGLATGGGEESGLALPLAHPLKSGGRAAHLYSDTIRF